MKWRERLSVWFTPLARLCPLSPNTISLVALALNLGAAALLAYRHFLAAIGLIAVGGLMDAFDGIVARVQQKESRFGDFLDHVGDRISDTALAACWMIGSGVREPLVVTGVILVMLNGYMGTQIEATWQKRSYESIGRAEFVLALIIFPIVSFLTNSRSVAEGLTVALIVFALIGVAQRFALARRMQ